MNSLQESLKINQTVDYADLLYYDEKKGFYCMIIKGKKKCMDKNKGRHYPKMTEESRNWLLEYYEKFNQDLKQLMTRKGLTLPVWLDN